MYLTPIIEYYVPAIRDTRELLFQALSEHSVRQLAPRYVKVLLINDDEYWKSGIQHNPIDRAYLAKIVQALDEANAAVIALDFNEELVDSGHPEKDLTTGTDKLIKAIARTAERRSIVLGKVFANDGISFAPDIYGLYGLCLQSKQNGTWNNPGNTKLGLYLSGDDDAPIVHPETC